MLTADEVLGWIILLFIASAFVLFIIYRLNPKNRVSRGLEAFWNTPSIKQFRMFVLKAFWVLFLGWLTLTGIRYYFDESRWYPREREVEVFFKAHQWIDGEIQTCHSVKSTTPKTPDAEVTMISCSSEQSESHVLRVKFWGPIKADKNKVWKCERSQSAMTCSLQ